MVRSPLGVLALLAALAASARAGDPFPLGPLGGSAGAVAIDPATGDVPVITFPEGLQRSTDGGAAGVGGSGSVDVNLPLPNEPLLVGLPIATQVVVNDGAAVAGRAPGNGLRTTFMP
jgi:hypothetical protein